MNKGGGHLAPFLFIPRIGTASCRSKNMDLTKEQWWAQTACPPYRTPQGVKSLGMRGYVQGESTINKNIGLRPRFSVLTISVRAGKPGRPRKRRIEADASEECTFVQGVN